MSLGLCASSMSLAVAAGGPQDVQLKLQARMFHSGTGNFSADLLSPGAPELVNVIAAPDPSTATLALVVLKLAPDYYLSSSARLSFVVREMPSRGRRGRLLLERTVSVGPVARGAPTHLPFWLQGTGCSPLSLSAKLVIPGQAAPVSTAAEVPFVCSE